MIRFIAALATFISASAHADIITCGFTEPFFTTMYSMAQQSLTIKDDVVGTTSVIKNVSFQIIAPGKFEIRKANGDVLQTLELTGNGSDGMSDLIYPYEVTNSQAVRDFGANIGVGGCESNYLRAKLGQN